jgi:hypothetical protein
VRIQKDKIKSFKTRVSLLEDYLQLQGHQISRMHLLEACARFEGSRNWKVLRAELAQPSAIIQNGVLSPLRGKSLKVYLEPCHTAESGGESPAHCFTVITDAWIHRALELQSLCRTKKLEVISDNFNVPDWGCGERYFGIYGDGVSFTPDYFWFYASLKNQDYCIETAQLPLNSFLAEVIAHVQAGKSEMYAFSNFEAYLGLLDATCEEDIDEDTGHYAADILARFDQTLYHRICSHTEPSSERASKEQY